MMHAGRSLVISGSVLLAVAVSVPTGSAYAGEYLRLEGNGAVVFHEGRTLDIAEAMLEIYPAARAEVEGALLWEVDFRPEIFLIKDRGEFREMTGNDLTVAFARREGPGRYAMTMDATNINIKPFTLDATLRHELCHLLLERRIKGGGLPRWLNEGTCQWAAGGPSEVMGLGRGSNIEKAALFKGLIPIRKLDRRFPSNGKSLLLAYEESRSIVSYVVGEFGSRALRDILENLRAGEDIDGAVENALSLTLDELERKWHGHLKGRHTWVSFLTNNLYPILFSLAALVTFLGFIRVLVRIKTYRDEEEEEMDDAG
jgi:hypothetical protein